ncbi:MAG: LacI family DNA-binding transcriptional regulator [Pseudomonadota bacterium]
MVDAKQAGLVTADDVARLAGVSRWTVNRAFKKDASISAKSRDKVMQAAKSLGYAPDLLAVSLASDRSGLVAVLLDDLKNPQQITMVEHLTTTLRDAGWYTLLVNTKDEDDAAAALLEASQHRVDAAVLIGGRFNDVAIKDALGAQRLKQLIVYGRVSQSPNTISICCDDTAAMTELTDHVLARGCQRPLFISGPRTISAHLLRKEAMMVRWREARGVLPEVLVADTFSPDLAYARVLDYFRALPRERYPDVLMCENDAIAMGAMDALRFELGLRVPEDIAITGFDDNDFASNHNYALTTYRQPNAEMAQAVVDVLRGAVQPGALSRMSGQMILRTSA